MPEHFHLLIHPWAQADPSPIIQNLKERTARFALKTLRQNTERAWRQKVLSRLMLPPTVHLHGPYRVWQRRFYDLNIWSRRKIGEKLNDMHGNPVKRGLVKSPEQWPWPSFRFYYFEDTSMLWVWTDTLRRTHCRKRDGCASRGQSSGAGIRLDSEEVVRKAA
jgi:REP-associated tyrosine transposase